MKTRRAKTTGGWWRSAATPQDGDIWGTAALCPSHPVVWTVCLAIWLALPLCADAQPPPSGDAPTLDDRLRRELEADPLNDLERELFEPPDPSDATAGDGGLKEQLQRELGNAAISENQHPLLSVARQMRQAAARIGEQDSGSRTQAMQNQIVADLDRLLKQTRKRCQQAPGGSQQTSPQEGTNQPPSQPPSGENPNNGPPSTNPPQNGGDPTEARKPDMNHMHQVIAQLLLELPGRNGQRVTQPFVEQFLPKYEQLIEDYYRRLAE